MTEHLLVGLASIVILGITAQWLAWYIRIPSIFLLLLVGFAAGPGTGWLHPQELMGDLLFPVVSLSVAIILFEGGLSLRMVVLRDIGRVLRNLITLGVVVTWGITALTAYVLLGFDLSLSLLIGAMLVVSGPTVVGPLLRHVRPIDRLRSTLQWEGILIDPIGVLLAVLVFEAILASSIQAATGAVLTGMVIMVVVGSILGFLGAMAMVGLIQYRLIPDYLDSAVTLMVVVATFTLANVLHEEAGLFTVTVMGIAMANQKAIVVRHIIEFKETLRVLLISSLFILLSARLQLEDIALLGWPSLVFLGVLILIARPVAVALSTLGSELPWQDRAFLAWIAPRGIVAAAMSSLFALRLSEAGYAQADQIVPLTFLVIVGTVAIYGLTAAPVARWLGVAQQNPQGVLFIGASPLAQAIAQALQEADYATCLIDTNWSRIGMARMAGLQTYYGSALTEEALDNIGLDGIGRVVALTPNDEANALAALHFAEIFGRNETYQLPSRDGYNDTPVHLRGQFLFSPEATYTRLNQHMLAGAAIKTTRLSEQFDYAAFQTFYQESAIPLFLILPNGNLQVWTMERPPTPLPGQSLISLIPAEVLETTTSNVPDSSEPTVPIQPT